MSFFALGLVLISAVFHATWNLLAKRAGADAPFLWLAYIVGAITFAPFAIAILVIARPELGWPALVFIAVAVGLQTLYFATLTAGYRAGDLSLVYPIARASGPLLATTGAIAIFGERPTAVAVTGALAIVAGACSRRATLCVGVSARQRWSLASSRWPLVDDDRYEACDIWRSHLVSPPMLRLLRLVALIALILALAPARAAAADIRSGQDITIATTDTIDDDLYVFGTNISINGTIHGDLIAGGSNISVDGNVTGDVIAAGNSVAIRGQVGGSVRAAGNTIVVDGKIANDLVVGGNELTIMGNGRVGRDAIVGSSNATISGQIGRDLQAGGANVKIDSSVGGNVTANVERLQITDRGTVGGSLKYTSKNEAQIANAASVKGSVERQTPDNGRAPLFSGTAALVVEL